MNSIEANKKLSSVQEEINSIKLKSIDSSKIESTTKPQDGSFEFSFSKKLSNGLGSIKNSKTSSRICSKLDSIRNSNEPLSSQQALSLF